MWREDNFLSQLFWWIGVIVCFLFASRIIYLLSRFSLAYFVKRHLFPVNYKQFGEWAVVTGATDGIGKSLAFELAKRGMNLVLISRSSEKLKATAEEIGSALQNIKFRTITADFSRFDIYDGIKEQLVGLDIGVLVNNVGKTSLGFYHLTENGDEMMSEIIAINCNSMHRMTWIVLPGMLKKKKGVVMNVSSGTGMCPMPMLSLYAGTKAFVRNFTESLHWEYANEGIIFKCVVPYFVATKMAGITKSSLFAPSADTFARSTLDMLDKTDTVAAVYWPHAFENWFVSVVPTWIASPLVIRLLKSAKEAKERSVASKLRQKQ